MRRKNKLTGCIVHSSHHPLIIAKEQNTQSCKTIDGYEKLSLLQMMDHIVFRDLVHGVEFAISAV